MIFSGGNPQVAPWALVAQDQVRQVALFEVSHHMPGVHETPAMTVMGSQGEKSDEKGIKH